MGAERLPMRRVRDVLRLKNERLSHRRIARACGMGVGTVSEYVERARRAGVSWPLPPELDDVALEARLFPAAPAGRERVLLDLAAIHQELMGVGVTLHLLWEEYRQVHGESGYGYSQYCELYRRWAGQLRPSMRQLHRAGEKLFVDFSGKRPSIVDRKTGELVAVELFVGVLGASGYTYAEATATQKLHDWLGAHERMLEYFGGSAAIWVPDQVKGAISESCRYEPGVNRTYQELASHYGAVVIPARPGKPRDKAKVEATVLVAQRWILARLRKRSFFDLVELNAAIRDLVDELNERLMQKLKVSRRELWERVDRPALKPLPAGSVRGVAVDPVSGEHRLPRRGRRPPLQRVVPAHRAAARGALHEHDRGGLPQGAAARFLPAAVRAWRHDAQRAHAELAPGARGVDAVSARALGREDRAACGRLVAGILKSRPHPEQGYRACLGLMRLGKLYGASRLEAACERAEHLRSYSYRTVKNILAASQDRLALGDEPHESATAAHDNIRGAEYDVSAAKEEEC
jgi:transposase